MNWYKCAQRNNKEWDAFFEKKPEPVYAPLNEPQISMLDTSNTGVKENKWVDVVDSNEKLRDYMGIGARDQAEQTRKNRGLSPLYKRRHWTWVSKHPEGQIPGKETVPRKERLDQQPKQLYTRLGPMPPPKGGADHDACDIAYKAYHKGIIKSKDAIGYKNWLSPIIPSAEEKHNNANILEIWEQYKDLFLSGEISQQQLINWRGYTQKAANNWYSMIKIAFPYGRIKCPSCRKTFANDFGFKDNANGGTSTQNVSNGKLPFVDFEKKQYQEPIDGVTEDQVERGTITVECPNCHQWLEVEYEWNTGSSAAQSADFFSQVIVTDIQKISSEVAHMYNQVGMTSGLSIPDGI